MSKLNEMDTINIYIRNNDQVKKYPFVMYQVKMNGKILVTNELTGYEQYEAAPTFADIYNSLIRKKLRDNFTFTSNNTHYEFDEMITYIEDWILSAMTDGQIDADKLNLEDFGELPYTFGFIFK